MSSSNSFIPLIARSLQELGLMSVPCVMALACRIVVARRTSIVFCMRKVVADRCCMLEDMSDRYST